VPFQHASPRILKLMKRPANAENTLARIGVARDLPDITIRSTFIAGFPGETETEFAQLLDFLEEAELDRVGLLRLLARRRRRGERIAGPRARKRCARSGARASWPRRSASARGGSARKVGTTMRVLVDEIERRRRDCTLRGRRARASTAWFASGRGPRLARRRVRVRDRHRLRRARPSRAALAVNPRQPPSYAGTIHARSCSPCPFVDRSHDAASFRR
jgi:tRNA A37 methylthiotransferase MiaB